MLKFLSGLGKEKSGDTDDTVANLLDDIQLEEFDIDVPAAPDHDQMHRTMFKTEVENLMNSVKTQSLEISCQFANFANWSAEIETLSARAATLQPLLTKLVEENSALASRIAENERSKEYNDQRIGELEAEVAHFRPLAARYEEELRMVKEKYSSAQSMISALEGQFAQRQTENNELMYSLAKAESKGTRLGEENVGLRQKALEHNTVIQSQMREIADLKSEVSNVSRALQKQEEISADLTAKLAAALESGSHASSTLSSVLMREAQAEKDFQARLAEADEQAQDLLQKLANRDKQLSAAEVKITGLNSKVEFLTQMAQKLREDLRGNMDHSNMVESSNRQLLDVMSKRGYPEEKSQNGVDTSKGVVRPKLRSVQPSHSPQM
jgi:predicted  nucleic acid-binding Zn-ribbon protein